MAPRAQEQSPAWQGWSKERLRGRGDTASGSVRFLYLALSVSWLPCGCWIEVLALSRGMLEVFSSERPGNFPSQAEKQMNLHQEKYCFFRNQAWPISLTLSLLSLPSGELESPSPKAKHVPSQGANASSALEQHSRSLPAAPFRGVQVRGIYLLPVLTS